MAVEILSGEGQHEESAFGSRYTQALVQTHYGRAPSRTLLMGGSNGGHHTKWMIAHESHYLPALWFTRCSSM
jgi:hypothetical protein